MNENDALDLLNVRSLKADIESKIGLNTMLVETQIADNVARLAHVYMGIRDECRAEWCDMIGMAPWLKERILKFCARFSEQPPREIA